MDVARSRESKNITYGCHYGQEPTWKESFVRRWIYKNDKNPCLASHDLSYSSIPRSNVDESNKEISIRRNNRSITSDFMLSR